MIAACEGTSHSFTVVSSEHERTCVWSRAENLTTWTGCLCESSVRRIARELMSKTCKGSYEHSTQGNVACAHRLCTRISYEQGYGEHSPELALCHPLQDTHIKCTPSSLPRSTIFHAPFPSAIAIVDHGSLYLYPPRPCVTLPVPPAHQPSVRRRHSKL